MPMSHFLISRSRSSRSMISCSLQGHDRDYGVLAGATGAGAWGSQGRPHHGVHNITTSRHHHASSLHVTDDMLPPPQLQFRFAEALLEEGHLSAIGKGHLQAPI